MAQQTAVEWICMQLLDFDNHKIWVSLLERAKNMEKQQLKDAVMYGLDEDGHTGDWKISVAENYYKKTYENNK